MGGEDLIGDQGRRPRVRAALRGIGRARVPGGEPLHEGADRVLDVFADLSRSHAGGTVLVVAHNTLLRLALCRMLGIELGQYRRLMPRVLNGAVSEVRFGELGGALYSFNDLGGPG
jgi:probable phosphoglycerate mutase